MNAGDQTVAEHEDLSHQALPHVHVSSGERLISSKPVTKVRMI
jgi:hypothetical protein